MLDGLGPDGVRRVDMQVFGLAVVMAVGVHVEASAPEIPEDLGAEEDQHDADAELEHGRRVRVAVEDRVLEQQDHDAQDEERRGVAEPPRGADPNAAPRAPEFPSDRRYGDDVIGVGSVLEAQQEAKCQRGDDSRVQVHW